MTHACLSQSRVREDKDGKWIVLTGCVVPYELVTLNVRHTNAHLFLLTEDKFYRKAGLTALFTCVGAKHPDYTSLTITLYSSRENLAAAIRNYYFPDPDVNPPVASSASDCSNLVTGTKPCSTGYYRAEYIRTPDREEFEFSPDPSKTTMTRVILRKSPAGRY